METDEKEMNMKNKLLLSLHCPMLESVLLKVIAILACCACLMAEMASTDEMYGRSNYGKRPAHCIRELAFCPNNHASTKQKSCFDEAEMGWKHEASCFFLLGEEVPQFAHPKHERGTEDDDDPIHQLEALHIEELLQTW